MLYLRDKERLPIETPATAIGWSPSEKYERRSTKESLPGRRDDP